MYQFDQSDSYFKMNGVFIQTFFYVNRIPMIYVQINEKFIYINGKSGDNIIIYYYIHLISQLYLGKFLIYYQCLVGSSGLILISF